MLLHILFFVIALTVAMYLLKVYKTLKIQKKEEFDLRCFYQSKSETLGYENEYLKTKDINNTALVNELEKEKLDYIEEKAQLKECLEKEQNKVAELIDSITKHIGDKENLTIAKKKLDEHLKHISKQHEAKINMLNASNEVIHSNIVDVFKVIDRYVPGQRFAKNDVEAIKVIKTKLRLK